MMIGKEGRFMNAVKKAKLIEYVEGVIQPSFVETMEFEKDIQDLEGETSVWLMTTDMGEEYWLLEGVYPVNVFKKAGIYQSVDRVYEAYVDAYKESLESEEQKDRFHQYAE